MIEELVYKLATEHAEDVGGTFEMCDKLGAIAFMDYSSDILLLSYKDFVDMMEDIYEDV